METVAVYDANTEAAAELLEQGFPARARRFWEAGLARMAESPAHRASGEPLGYLLTCDGRQVGIVLAPVRLEKSRGCNKVRRVVNLSSWYVEPDHRWRFPALLRRMMKDPDAVYTDLTASPDIRPMLESLGFRPMNNGVSIVFTPSAALLRWSSPPVVPIDKAAHPVAAELARVFSDHESYGCRLYSIESDGHSIPVVIKPTMFKGIPSARVIYCGDNRKLSAALGSLARKLLSCGVLCLLLDLPVGARPSSSLVQVARPARQRRYIKNGRQGHVTDYTYSELAFFDL